MLKKTKSTNAGFRLTGPSVRIQTDISTVCRSRECRCGELANKHAHQRKRVLVGLFFLRKITSPPVDPGRGCFHVFRAMEPLVVFACVDTLNAVAYSLSADGRTGPGQGDSLASRRAFLSNVPYSGVGLRCR
ncbi:hypothetical protein DPMN_131373 [Dreissena polymorpha]|uniref:Uncharacterized protein n=1 Tax=Dreissena polymorpha TaxID=45954 RepID=A0A9D4H6V3_DREPO|nr:hypothetical protein DPMN_131373 [Dreissena polymorpha]